MEGEQISDVDKERERERRSIKKVKKGKRLTSIFENQKKNKNKTKIDY